MGLCTVVLVGVGLGMAVVVVVVVEEEEEEEEERTPAVTRESPTLKTSMRAPRRRTATMVVPV